MKIYKTDTPFDFKYLPNDVDTKSTLFIDIETTGLSPDLCTIFMIGCSTFQDNCLHTIQWMADTLEVLSEKDILTAFSEYLSNMASCTAKIQLITYNGRTFDLPFLQARYVQLEIADPLVFLENSIFATDLYRYFKSYKKLWPVANMKLHTMAHWLTGSTPKSPSGKLLIRTFHDYIKTKDPETLNLLFQHNLEDLTALASLLVLYNYIHFFNGQYTLEMPPKIEDRTLLLQLSTSLYLPVPIAYDELGFHFLLQNHQCNLSIPIYPRGLRYYYSDTKNYVYLPVEDYAVHKSMTAYINKDHFVKASPENCYTWFTLDEAFLKDTSLQHKYIQMIFKLFRFI